MTIGAALDRTLLLMRTDLHEWVDDELLLGALTSTTVVLAADTDVLATRSGQAAFITAAMLMARSGHAVWIRCPDAPLIGPQPPLAGCTVVSALQELGGDLLPGWQFQSGGPRSPADLLVTFGRPHEKPAARQILQLQAEDWVAIADSEQLQPWMAGDWPVGGLAAATVGAGEAFKAAMRKLKAGARSRDYFDEVYAPTTNARIALAPPHTPMVPRLPDFDMISGGAIGNAVLYTLLRLPDVSGRARIIDDDTGGLSNLNRNALLRYSQLGKPKVDDLASYSSSLKIEPVSLRYVGSREGELPLRKVVLVGVDHIPSRWSVQASRPAWLAIGATEAFSVQISYHEAGTACAQCVHPSEAQDTRRVPTVAFVSFWSGLLLAVGLLRHVAGVTRPRSEQQQFFSAVRPETWINAASDAPIQPFCRTCGGQGC
ncbi:MAG: ThiF family adenylyltransferase [Bradyrhizobiaceae bacterium]|nr:ThiF family adenylyltransferase [Bradyrhizobiaceae bacterium]